MNLKSKHLTCAMTARDHANADTDPPSVKADHAAPSFLL